MAVCHIGSPQIFFRGPVRDQHQSSEERRRGGTQTIHVTRGGRQAVLLLPLSGCQGDATVCWRPFFGQPCATHVSCGASLTLALCSAPFHEPIPLVVQVHWSNWDSLVHVPTFRVALIRSRWSKFMCFIAVLRPTPARSRTYSIPLRSLALTPPPPLMRLCLMPSPPTQ